MDLRGYDLDGSISEQMYKLQYYKIKVQAKIFITINDKNNSIRILYML